MTASVSSNDEGPAHDRSTLTRSVACAIACAGLSIFTRGAAAQIMSAPATPNATPKGTKGQLAVDFQLGNGQLIAAGKRYVRQ